MGGRSRVPFRPDKCWQGKNINVIKGGDPVDTYTVWTKSTMDVAVESIPNLRISRKSIILRIERGLVVWVCHSPTETGSLFGYFTCSDLRIPPCSRNVVYCDVLRLISDMSIYKYINFLRSNIFNNFINIIIK